MLNVDIWSWIYYVATLGLPQIPYSSTFSNSISKPTPSSEELLLRLWRQNSESCLVCVEISQTVQISPQPPISKSPVNANSSPKEQLMGAGASSRHAQLSLTDPKVCRSYLAGTCPHDLFTNTKQDLGPCPKVHSEPLKTEYEAAPEKSKYGFEYDYMRDMQKYIDECNRRIDAAQRRLEKTPDEIRQTNDLVRRLCLIPV